MHERHISGKGAKIKGKGVEHEVVVVMARYAVRFS